MWMVADSSRSRTLAVSRRFQSSHQTVIRWCSAPIAERRSVTSSTFSQLPGSKSGKRGKSRNASGRTPAPPTAKPRAARHTLYLAAIIGFTLFAYSNSFHALFLFDNDHAILKDPRVQAVTSDNIRRILTHSYWEANPTGLYRPLTTLSYLFNFAVLEDGPNPPGYHWINFILHAVNIGL